MENGRGINEEKLFTVTTLFVLSCFFISFCFSFCFLFELNYFRSHIWTMESNIFIAKLIIVYVLITLFSFLQCSVASCIFIFLVFIFGAFCAVVYHQYRCISSVLAYFFPLIILLLIFLFIKTMKWILSFGMHTNRMCYDAQSILITYPLYWKPAHQFNWYSLITQRATTTKNSTNFHVTHWIQTTIWRI